MIAATESPVDIQFPLDWTMMAVPRNTVMTRSMLLL